ncbi:O-GlcNAc transferase [Minicystis rosea]|nr:O-GlcNAc transferase [Minicystis rosea]
MSEDARRRLAAYYPLSLAALVILAYLPALGASWVWDDDVNIVTNGALRDASGLARIWTDVTVTQQYYPLTHTTFWAQYQMSGLWFPAYHAVNVALHAATAVLLLLVLRRLAVKGAELAAALFALHPLQVESVAWVTERKNVLSGALGLASVLLYLRFDEEEERAKRWRFWAGALGLFALALLAKTAVAVIPAALLVVLVILRGRRGIGVIGPLAPFLAVGAAAGLLTAHLEHGRVGAHGVEFAWTFGERVLVAGRAFCFYWMKLLWPSHLAFFYPRWDIDSRSAVQWLWPLAAAASLIGALMLVRRGRATYAAAALLAYAALIFPALGFFNVYFMRFAQVQNHFAYLASMPALALIGAGITRLAERVPRREIVLGAIPLLCGALSAREATAFRDYETLFLRALEANPEAWVAAYDLGLHYQKQDRRADAIAMFRRARAARAGDAEIAGSLGSALAEAGELDEAIPLLREAADGKPEQADARFNYGLGLEMVGRAAEAAAAYREAVRLRPDWPRAQRQLAWLLSTTDDPAVRDGRAAVPLAESACARTKQTLSRCLDTLAAAHAASGDFEKARATAQKAVGLSTSPGEKATYEGREKLYARGEALWVKRGTRSK